MSWSIFLRKLAATHDGEQQSLTVRLHTLASDLEAIKRKQRVSRNFSLIKWHTEVQELTPTIVNELIK